MVPLLDWVAAHTYVAVGIGVFLLIALEIAGENAVAIVRALRRAKEGRP